MIQMQPLLQESPGQDPRRCTCAQLPGDADAAVPRTNLSGKGLDMSSYPVVLSTYDIGILGLTLQMRKQGLSSS